MRPLPLRAALVAGIAAASLSFAPPRLPLRRAATTTALSSDGPSADEAGLGGVDDDFEKERMNIVRMIQKSYYRDAPDGASVGTTAEYTAEFSSHSARASLDPATGRINNLPLWRVGWVETPGRRNCLNVHEMHFTHMFERILSRRYSAETDDEKDDDPLYFGHLCLPGGTSSAKSAEERYRLKTWREELVDEDRFDDGDDRSAVVGCLMQILDHRRLDDGRLMILVQALERFVVEEVVDTKPYSVANVQVLLDKEDLPWEGSEVDEDFCRLLRGKAVEASFHYHDYEFGDRPKLPVKNNASGYSDHDDEQYVSKEDIPWVAISKLLPFARYSTDEICLDAANEKTASVRASAAAALGKYGSYAGGEPSLEQSLWNGGITWDPPPVPNVVQRRTGDAVDCDDLETLLWLALDDFCRATGFTLPEEVRILLPPEMDYLDVATDRRLASSYPKLRRQRRLSYLAPALIENLDAPEKSARQVWLNAPSTAARLRGALERYDYLNNKIMGQFE